MGERTTQSWQSFSSRSPIRRRWRTLRLNWACWSIGKRKKSTSIRAFTTKSKRRSIQSYKLMMRALCLQKAMALRQVRTLSFQSGSTIATARELRFRLFRIWLTVKSLYATNKFWTCLAITLTRKLWKMASSTGFGNLKSSKTVLECTKLRSKEATSEESLIQDCINRFLKTSWREKYILSLSIKKLSIWMQITNSRCQIFMLIKVHRFRCQLEFTIILSSDLKLRLETNVRLAIL